MKCHKLNSVCDNDERKYFKDEKTFPFQSITRNYSMQMCNTVDNSLNQTTNPNVVASTSTSQLNNSSTSLFSINEDSNGVRDTTRKSTRDPLSHRIIEKKRRDRMNKCLTDLSKLIPQQYIKKGRGRIEKTEIVEMAIKYIKNLQNNNLEIADYETGFYTSLNDKTKSNKNNLQSSYFFNKDEFNSFHKEDTNDTLDSNLLKNFNRNVQNQFLEDFRLGYLECLNQTVKLNFNNFSTGKINLELKNHLKNHLETISKTFSQDKETILEKKLLNKNAVEGLQIKLEEMDVEEQLNENSNIQKSKSEKCAIKNCLAKNQIQLDKSNIDIPNQNDTMQCFDVLNCNNNLKSRSLTSSPNSTSDSSYKFKKYINNRFETDLLKNKDGYLNGSNTCTRPRSATIGSNLSSLRNNVLFESRDKLISSSKELSSINLEKKSSRVNSKNFLLNSTVSFNQNPLFSLSNLYPNLDENKKQFSVQSLDLKQSLDNNLDSTLISNNKPQLTNITQFAKIQPGFVLHPNMLYYVPIQIDLTSIMNYFKPNSFVKQEVNNNNLLCQQVQENNFSLTNQYNNNNLNNNNNNKSNLKNNNSNSNNNNSSNTDNTIDSCNNNQSSIFHTLHSSLSSISTTCSTNNSQFSSVNLINNLNNNNLNKNINLNQGKLDFENTTRPHPISIDVNFAFSALPLSVYAINPHLLHLIA